MTPRSVEFVLVRCARPKLFPTTKYPDMQLRHPHVVSSCRKRTQSANVCSMVYLDQMVHPEFLGFSCPKMSKIQEHPFEEALFSGFRFARGHVDGVSTECERHGIDGGRGLAAMRVVLDMPATLCSGVQRCCESTWGSPTQGLNRPHLLRDSNLFPGFHASPCEIRSTDIPYSMLDRAWQPKADSARSKEG